jgi:hypothetical protein
MGWTTGGVGQLLGIGGGREGEGGVPVSVRMMVKLRQQVDHLSVIIELQKLGMPFRHSREQL